MKNTLAPAAALIALASPVFAPLSAQEEAATAPSPNEIVDAAPDSEWVAIPAEDLLVMKLAPDRDGKSREVVIQLMPAPFSQGWVENIRTLARAKWYDGISVNRVQDNYVVQWGDPGHDNPESGDVETKPLPDGLNVMGEEEYTVDGDVLSDVENKLMSNEDFTKDMEAGDLLWIADKALEAVLANKNISQTEKMAAVAEYFEMTQVLQNEGVNGSKPRLTSHDIAMISINSTATTRAPTGWHQRDSQADWVQIWRGWPLGNLEIGKWSDREGNTVPAPMLERNQAFDQGYSLELEESTFWPIHCYGMVGVGRNYSPDTGSGAELYTVIGHAPRHLDRNIALAGRIISGMEHLSSLPRGSGVLGFYTEEEADKRTPILSIRVASDLPEAERPVFEYLSTESETFARYAEARANRRDPFFIVPAGGADICNMPVPVRPVSNTVSNE